MWRALSKIVKKSKFEEVWGKLEQEIVSRANHSQNIWNYL